MTRAKPTSVGPLFAEMEQQINTLFSEIERHPYAGLPPHQKHSATSTAAAKSVEPSAATKRGFVLQLFREAPRGGLTDHELQALTGWENPARPRRCELVKLGLVEDSSMVRKSPSGRWATVWRAVRKDVSDA